MVPDGVAADVNAFVADYYAFHPHSAVWDGLHEHDGAVPDYSKSVIQRRITELERWGARFGADGALTATPKDGGVAARSAMSHLGTQTERDVALVEHARDFELFRWRDWRPHERNPGFYHGALDVSIYVKRSYAPAAERLAALIRHLHGVRDILAMARENLRLPLSRPATEHAIHTYAGLADFYDHQIRTAGAALIERGRDTTAFTAALGVAIGAVRRFIAFLREQMANPDGDFRLGADLFAQMIKHGEMVDLPLERVRAATLEDLAINEAGMAEIAGRMGIAVPEAIAMLDQARVPEDRVLAVAATAVEELRAFLADNTIVDLDIARGTTYYTVETPAFMRAGAAFMDVPGPFERPGQPAYFYVTLPDPAWPASARDAWLAKLNPWGLRNTAAHETYPGHLLHFLHVARVPSVAARAFTSYACVEGWAHYAEQMVVEAGFARGDLRYELATRTMAVLRDCRCLVALELHAGNATVQEATDLIATHTHLAPIRCRQEAQRGAQDPGYLYYVLGKLMVLKLRADYARQEGQRYTPKRFHEALLACGAPPVPLARRMVLDNPAGDLF